jgi:hypothetical protein
MAKNNQRGKNNNPQGRNQYSNSWVDTARERPLAAAATAAAAVGAGVFLWSRRNQITDQLSSLTDQISEWREGMSSDSNSFGQDDGTAGDSFIASSGSGSSSGSGARRGGRRSQSEISEEALTLKETGKTA